MNIVFHKHTPKNLYWETYTDENGEESLSFGLGEALIVIDGEGYTLEYVYNARSETLEGLAYSHENGGSEALLSKLKADGIDIVEPDRLLEDAFDRDEWPE